MKNCATPFEIVAIFFENVQNINEKPFVENLNSSNIKTIERKIVEQNYQTQIIRPINPHGVSKEFKLKHIIFAAIAFFAIWTSIDSACKR